MFHGYARHQDVVALLLLCLRLQLHRDSGIERRDLDGRAVHQQDHGVSNRCAVVRLSIAALADLRIQNADLG